MENVKIALSVITLIAVFAFGLAAIDEISKIEMNVEVPACPTYNFSIPTADDISSGIEIPDTFYSVKAEKKDMAYDLVLEELEKDGFLEDLAEYIEDNTEAQDIDEDDLEALNEDSIRDYDIDLVFDDASVKVELKVHFNNFGDEDEREYARVSVIFNVHDLDYDDDFDDAEVEGYSFEEILRTSF